MIAQIPPLNPDDFLHFVELDEFVQDWKDLRLDSDDDMWSLCTTIMLAPTASPVVQGTRGLRKLRFAPPSWHQGKSGACRVCYAYFPRHWLVLLIMVYEKSEKDNLSAAERRSIRVYLEQLEDWLDRRAEDEK
jgi:hypothetical protein